MNCEVKAAELSDMAVNVITAAGNNPGGTAVLGAIILAAIALWVWARK